MLPISRVFLVLIIIPKSIPRCSVLAKPLLLLTHGRKESKAKFTWGEDQQASFEALKEHLTSAPILRFLDFKKKFFIETDASKIGLGAMLSQSHSYYGIGKSYQWLTQAIA